MLERRRLRRPESDYKPDLTLGPVKGVFKRTGTVPHGAVEFIIDPAAKEFLTLPDVDGCLVGGASLNADEFWAIALASQKLHA